MTPRANVQASIVVGRLDPVDVANFDEANLSRALDDDPFDLLPLMMAAVGSANPVFGSRHGQLKPCIIERLQQIIQCSSLEGTQSVLVICGDKYDRIRQVRTENLDHIETVTFRHLYIEKEQLWFCDSDLAQGLRAR